MFYPIKKGTFHIVKEERNFLFLGKITCLKNGRLLFVYYDLETKLITYRIGETYFASSQHKNIRETILTLFGLPENTYFFLTKLFIKKGRKPNPKLLQGLDWETIFQKHRFTELEFLYY